MTLHERVNAESRNGLAAAIAKHPFGTCASGDQRRQLGGCLRPEWTMTHFVALPSNLHGRIPVAGDMSEFEIGDDDLRRFISASSRVTEKQQEGVIAPSLRGVPVG